MSVAANRLLVDSYLGSIRTQRKLSGHTVSNYGRDLAELLQFAEPIVNDATFAVVTHFHIRKFASQLHSNGLNARSIARKLSCWRGFFDWLSQEIALNSNPVDGVKAPKRSKPLPKALSADDAVRLVAHACPGKNAEATLQRCNRAMFELLYSSGLRVSELVGLDWRYTRENDTVSLGWIDFDAHEVTVTGKGGKMRSVPIGGAAMEALTDWLAVRASLVKNDPAPLFLSERGSRMSVRVVQLRLKAHAQALGIPSDIHPHVLRHSFASHVLQSSGDLRAVQEMLGHASIAATQVYTSLDFQRLAQVYDASHPRAKKKESDSLK
jgi:integrase/recombinase XerC